MRHAIVGALMLATMGATCSEGNAFPANGPRDDVEYWKVTCRDSSTCWGTVHEQCPARYVVDERDGQQVTNALLANGTAYANSHAEQTWLFHCLGPKVE